MLGLDIPDYLFIPIVVVAVLLVLGIAFWARYKTVGPDEGMIVTGSFLGSNHISDDGSGRKIKIVRGAGRSFCLSSRRPSSCLCFRISSM